MNITNRTFYDDNGNVISEEEHKQLLKKFQDDVDAKYNRIVNDPVDISTLSNEEKYKRMRTLEGIEKLATILDLN